MLKKIYLFLFLSIIVSQFGFSQSTDPDVQFAKAREMSYNNKKQEAIEILENILTKYPDYADVRLFLANLYSWSGNYNKARTAFEFLIAKNENEKAYWIGIIKNEIYDDRSVDALTRVFQGLNVIKNDPTITTLKAQIELYQNKPFKAQETLKKYLKTYPDSLEVKKYLSTIKDNMATNTLTVGVGTDMFSSIYDQMHYFYGQYSKETQKGTVVARYNLNRKFNTFGSQIEMDAYPSLGKGRYAFLNIGYSNSFIFPTWRYGAQVYQNLPKAVDASLGFRLLNFSGSKVWIYTGSLGKYYGNSYFFITPYIIPSDEGFSKSLSLTYRKYTANEDQYFGVRVGFGFSPEINRFGADALTKGIISLKAQNINLTNNFKIKNNRNLVGSSLGLTHQESIFDPGIYYWILSLNLSYGLSY
jgi:YaiO family outer membrane protein